LRRQKIHPMKESTSFLEKEVYPEMHTYMPQSIETPSKLHERHASMPHGMEAPSTLHKRHPMLKVLPLLLVVGAGIILSLKTNNLFMKELVLSGLVFLMVMFIRSTEEVARLTTQEKV